MLRRSFRGIVRRRPIVVVGLLGLGSPTWMLGTTGADWDSRGGFRPSGVLRGTKLRRSRIGKVLRYCVVRSVGGRLEISGS